MKTISEFQIQEASVEFLQCKGLTAWVNPTTGYHDGKGWRKQASRFARNGVSDIICVYKGKTSFIEVKKHGGVQSADQKSFESDMENQQTDYFLVYSVKDTRDLYNSGKLG